MPNVDDATFIRELYASLLGRAPKGEEESDWAAVLRGGVSDRKVFRKFITSPEYRAKHRVHPGHPLGHYYSPVVDPITARKFWSNKTTISPDQLMGMAISIPEMLVFWQQLSPILATTSFPKNKKDSSRYYWNNSFYSIGDAAVLRAMIGYKKPRRIIEIGSGFSSACMLDTLDELHLNNTRLTFIEPYPERLLSLLREHDRNRTTLIQSMVQNVDLGLFDELERDDIAFIDSSHVLKTGSDVNFELFDILPRLKSGVVIHFHDVHYPFELPERWVFRERYSWNEVYALRAFLMYNSNFKVLFFNHLFAVHNRDAVDRVCPEILTNPGGSLWIQKVAM